MRHLLGILLVLAILLAAAWSAASLFAAKAMPGSTRTDQQFKKRMNQLEESLFLAPANAFYWNQRARLAMTSGSVLPPQQRDCLGESSWYQAAVLAPSWEVPLLSLANQCAARQHALSQENPDNCRILYLAVLLRNPTYGYARYRYADFLYDQASKTSPAYAIQVNTLCRQYGQSLHLMRVTLQNNAWYRKSQARAYSRCIGLAVDYDQARLLNPETAMQWQLMGLGMGEKLGIEGWMATRHAIFADLKQKSADLDQYKALAYGLEKADLSRVGAEVLRQYLVTAPSDAKAWIELLVCMLRRRKAFTSTEITHALEQATSQSAFTQKQMIWLASAARQVGELEMALGILKKATSINPAAPNTFVNLGDCYLAAGHPKKAIEAYKQAIRLSPNSSDYHVYLGMAYAKDRQFEAAVQAIQRALGLNPNNKRAKAALKKMGIY